MALDGIFLSAVNLELQDWINSRVDRVFQISKFEIVLVLRKPRERANVLISANASSARINFTKKEVSRVKIVPPFCVLLRKCLIGARLKKTEQLGFDRVLFLKFENRNEIGDLVNYVLAVELMGKHSNIILLEESSKKIIYAIKLSEEEVENARLIRPKAVYKLFNLQNKLNLENCSLKQLINRVFYNGSLNLSSALLKSIGGISPIVARELAFGLDDKTLDDFDESEKQEVLDILKKFKKRVVAHDFCFIALLDDEKPKEFCWFDLKQFGNLLNKKCFSSASELLEFFYDEKLKVERINQCCYNVVKRIKNEIEKVKNKKEIRQKELSEAENFDDYKKYADLLYSNIYKIKKGDEKIEVVDFYNNGEKLLIKLRSDKTPTQNIQHFYHLYKKSRNARQLLKNLISDCDDEVKFLESELDVVMRARSENDVFSVISDLEQCGVFKNKHSRIKAKIGRVSKFSFLKYESTDGFEILCGKNNKQNDYLTLKKAQKTDLWLHVKDYSGAHVIILTQGKVVPQQTIVEAATIAVQNSSVSGADNVAVDYTLVKYVKKPNGGRVGMVIFKNNKTIFVSSNPNLVEKLKLK